MKYKKSNKKINNRDIINENIYDNDRINLTSVTTPTKDKPLSDLVLDIMTKHPERQMDRHEIFAEGNILQQRSPRSLLQQGSPMGHKRSTPRHEGPGSHYI